MASWRDPENSDVARGLGEATVTGSGIAMLVAAAGFAIVRAVRCFRGVRLEHR